jgi:acetyl-CoA synthetase
MGEYEAMYKRSINDSDGFWGDMARKHLDWFSAFTSVQHGTFAAGDIAWFLNGKLNASHQCIDRHIANGLGEKVAILFEGDHPSDVRTLTYNQLFTEVCKCANALKRQGVRKGDAVCLYMPMVPAAAVAMLACARIGAPHSVGTRAGRHTCERRGEHRRCISRWVHALTK